MKMRKLSKAVFSNSRGDIYITDPCYEQKSMGRYTVECKVGQYLCFYKTKNKRVSTIAIIHKDYAHLKNELLWIHQGDIGVDAGLAGFFKSPKPDFNENEWVKFVNELNLDNKQGPLLVNNEHGYFSETNLGDGVYPFYTANGTFYEPALSPKEVLPYGLLIDFRYEGYKI